MRNGRAAALAPGTTPPERIDLGDVLLRRWRPEDLEPRRDAMLISREHLSTWMDGITELVTVDGQRAYSRTASDWPSAEGDFRYGIFDLDGRVLGGINLHDRVGPGAVELGYWCHVAHSGRGVVITRAAAALTGIALDLPGIHQVEVHCDAANTRSAAVPQRLGFRLDRVQPREKCTPAESGEEMCWVKHRSPSTTSADTTATH
ncbi:GNAT family N-acetyltransferase [Nocardia sp. NPDC020380]|uniref:GNAT family N-acetyltransferase n=1 Tax=Nocardia sp. NPDC020380 TaxID=3364309 RepID=UPI0037BE0F63